MGYMPFFFFFFVDSNMERLKIVTSGQILAKIALICFKTFSLTILALMYV
jgi:hypothetical protein